MWITIQNYTNQKNKFNKCRIKSIKILGFLIGVILPRESREQKTLRGEDGGGAFLTESILACKVKGKGSQGRCRRQRWTEGEEARGEGRWRGKESEVEEAIGVKERIIMNKSKWVLNRKKKDDQSRGRGGIVASVSLISCRERKEMANWSCEARYLLWNFQKSQLYLYI